MLSKEGCLYLFSGHALYAALQIYYEYLSGSNFGGWSLEYEELGGWIIEEAVFPAENEGLASTENLDSQNIAELLGDAVYASIEPYFLKTNQNTVSDNDEHVSIYLGYCLWILNLLEVFDSFMTSNELKHTNYYLHYLEGKEVFEDLRGAIQTVIKTQQVSTIIFNTSSRLAENLGGMWRQQVIAEVDTYINTKR